jgi:hypothetical protein
MDLWRVNADTELKPLVTALGYKTSGTQAKYGVVESFISRNLYTAN